MKAVDIRNLSVEEIKAKLAEEKASYNKLIVSHKVAQVENPIGIRHLRRTIARLSTILNEKQAETVIE